MEQWVSDRKGGAGNGTTGGDSELQNRAIQDEMVVLPDLFLNF